MNNNFIVEPLAQKTEQSTRSYIPPKEPWWGRFRAWGKYVAILYVGVIVLIVVFLLTIGSNGFSSSSVSINIDAPQEITAGQTITYTIEYENTNKAPLEDVELGFIYPDDSIVITDTGVSTVTNEIINIDTIPGKTKAILELKAIIVGNHGDIKDARVLLKFRPENLRSEIEITDEHVSTITSVSIPLDLVAPPTIIPGQTITYIIDYKNESEEIFKDMVLRIIYPDGFTPSKESPLPRISATGRDKVSIWEIPRLRPDEGERIIINGILTGKEREAKEISVVLQRIINIDGKEVTIDFQRIHASSIISSPPLKITTKVNGGIDTIAELNSRLSYEITFRNDSNNLMSGVVVSAKLSGTMFDLPSVNSNGFFDSRTNTIFWDASSIPELGLLRANQSGIAKFTINLKDSFTGSGLSTANSLIKVVSTIETKDIPDGLGVIRLFAEDELITSISTAPTFQQKLSAIDPIFGSQGPFPPVIDQTTILTIHWKLINPINKVSPARVSTTLSPGVSWQGVTRTIGTNIEPKYNPTTQQISWDLGELPGGLGTTSTPYEAFFQIAITPSTNQINKNVDLLQSSMFSGTDVFTNGNIDQKVDGVGTGDTNQSDGSVKSQL